MPMNKNQSTIQDVAKAANVSIGTVDRVLHNRGRVSKEKETAILAAIEALDYKPSPIASALAARKGNIKIGITYPNVETEFWAEVSGGIERARAELLPFGIELIVEFTKSYDSTDQQKAIENIKNKGISGLVLTPVADTSADFLERAIGGNIPYVTVVDDVLQGNRIFHIGPDDFALGVLAAKLASLYNRSQSNAIILSANANFSGTQQRISGFMSKIKQDSLDINILRICPITGESEEEYYANIYHTALNCIADYSSLNTFYVTNGLTEWAAAAAKKAGKGDDFVIIGHEYTSGVRSFLESGLVGATIYQNPSQQWYLAIRMLYNYLSGNLSLKNRVFTTDCSILMKETLPLRKFEGSSF